MAKLTLTDLSGGYASIAELNANFALIETAFENTLSRDGTTPNQMGADIDLNSHDLLNVNDGYFTRLKINGVWATASLVIVDAASVNFTPAGSIAATDVQAAIEELDTETTAALALKMDKSANLSDVADVATARSNLGVLSEDEILGFIIGLS